MDEADDVDKIAETDDDMERDLWLQLPSIFEKHFLEDLIDQLLRKISESLYPEAETQPQTTSSPAASKKTVQWWLTHPFVNALCDVPLDERSTLIVGNESAKGAFVATLDKYVRYISRSIKDDGNHDATTNVTTNDCLGIKLRYALEYFFSTPPP